MTTKLDNISQREAKLGEGQEQTVGVPENGMQDPSGQFPKVDYHYGPSLNKASVGTQVNKLATGGGDVGVSLNIVPQRPSQYPFNDVNETPSGHVVEYDDTPGGERILIKHRKGSGVEMRADGTVIITSTNNKVEVTGGDQTVIVEGEGNLIYNGNLNLKVTGDFNVDVGGNYNVNVAGNMVEDIQENHRTTVVRNSTYTTKQTRTTKTVGTHTDIMLADNNQIVKGNQSNLVEGNIDIASEDKIFVSGKEQFAVTSKVSNITGAKQITVFGNKGLIGGKEVDYTGKAYYGSKGAIEAASNAIFYGTFKGVATEAIRSVNADFADKAKTAFQAQKAGTAGSIGAGGAATDPSVTLHSLSQEAITGQDAPITPDLVVDHSLNGSYAIRTVVVDAEDKLKTSLLLEKKYEGYFYKIPTIAEVRSALKSSYVGDAVGSILVADGLLNPDYKSPTPPAIGRTAKKSASSRFGYQPIGNALENRGKRFRP